MSKIITLQPSEHVDHITDDGHEMTQRPYPFHVNPDGTVQRQDFWRGDPARVVGFQNDLSVQKIDIWWREVYANPELAVGRYVVTADSEGGFGVHQLAIRSAVSFESQETP